MNDLVRTLKALSEETRLQMIALLLVRDELCVCDFVEALGLTQSKASRHLRYLYNAGLVEDRRQGLWIHYRISPSLTQEQAAILAAVSTAIGDERKRELDGILQGWLDHKVGSEEAVSAAGTSVQACC